MKHPKVFSDKTLTDWIDRLTHIHWLRCVLAAQGKVLPQGKIYPEKKSTPEKIHNFDPIKLILEKLKALMR